MSIVYALYSCVESSEKNELGPLLTREFVESLVHHPKTPKLSSSAEMM
jgi:hypothetical protein